MEEENKEFVKWTEKSIYEFSKCMRRDPKSTLIGSWMNLAEGLGINWVDINYINSTKAHAGVYSAGEALFLVLISRNTIIRELYEKLCQLNPMNYCINSTFYDAVLKLKKRSRTSEMENYFQNERVVLQVLTDDDHKKGDNTLNIKATLNPQVKSVINEDVEYGCQLLETISSSIRQNIDSMANINIKCVDRTNVLEAILGPNENRIKINVSLVPTIEEMSLDQFADGCSNEQLIFKQVIRKTVADICSVRVQHPVSTTIIEWTVEENDTLDIKLFATKEYGNKWIQKETDDITEKVSYFIYFDLNFVTSVLGL